MEIIAFILFIVAAVLFFLSTYPISNSRSRLRNYDLVSLGLFVLTVGFIVQFCSKHHPVRF